MRGSHQLLNYEHKELLLETATYHMNPLIISLAGIGAESTSADRENPCVRIFAAVMEMYMLNKPDEHIKKVIEFINKSKHNLEGYNDCLD